MLGLYLIPEASDKCFSDEVKELIINLSYIYKIDNMNMQGLVRSSLNERGLIDKNELRNALNEIGLSETVRGEQLTMEQLAQLSDLI